MTPNRLAPFAATVPEESDTFISVLYQQQALERGLLFRDSFARYLVPDQKLDYIPDSFGTTICSVRHGHNNETRLITREDAMVYVALGPSRMLQVHTATAKAGVGQAVYDELKVLKERPRFAEKEEVNINFWSLGPNGPRALERTIAINPWDKVQGNYTPQTGTELQKLMAGFKPSRAGQLILWHGSPGTGKTHALRALAWEWRKWCSIHYITDPELFFGTSATYMLDVLLLRRNGMPDYGHDDDDEDDDEASSSPKEKIEPWRLLVLEDSGELMVPDAKAQTGQGLSRLLNVVDGLIGQGLRILVLVTTNEVLKKLHPAVARPGRCAARIEFGEFKREEATAWLAQQATPILDVTLTNGVISLAELYEKVGLTQIVAEDKKQTFGFVSK